MSDEIDKRLQRAQQEAQERRAAATDALKNAPAEAHALANEIEQQIKENLADLFPSVTPLTAPMGRGASERASILGTPGGFQVQFEVAVKWTPSVGYGIGWENVRISPGASFRGTTSPVNVRVFTNTPGKTEIDFTSLREALLRVAERLCGQV